MEGRGLVVDYSRGDRRAHDLRGHAVAPRGAAVLLAPARHPRAPHPGRHARHRRRLRAEGHGPARRDVPDARRAEGRRAGEVDRGPAREPARRGQVAPRARRRATMAFDADGAILAAHIDFVSDCGAYPTPWPVGTAGRGRHAVPRARTASRAPASRRSRLHQHRRPHRVPRAVAVRVARPRGAARHRGAADGHRSRRAAPPQPAAPRRAAVREPERHALRQHLAARDVRAGARDARLRRVPRASRPRPAPPGRYLGVGMSQLRRAVDARATATTRPRRATIRIEPSGTVNVYIAGGSTGNSLETTVVQLTADALGVDIDDVAHDPGRHRGHRLRRRRGREPQRVDDRRRGRARPPTILRERIVAIAAHKLEAARRRHRAGRAAGPACAARPSIGISLAEIAAHRLLRAARAAARRARPGSRRARATPREAPIDLGQRHPRLHVRGRRRHRRRSRCCATS